MQNVKNQYIFKLDIYILRRPQNLKKMSNCQIKVGDFFFKLCGLLRKPQLYFALFKQFHFNLWMIYWFFKDSLIQIFFSHYQRIWNSKDEILKVVIVTLESEIGKVPGINVAPPPKKFSHQNFNSFLHQSRHWGHFSIFFQFFFSKINKPLSLFRTLE